MKSAVKLLVCLLVLTSCSNSFNKILKSKDYNYKLQKADEFYANKKYQKAEQLYMELFPVFKGTQQFEDLYYKYAFGAFYQKHYVEAQELFKGFLGFFPNSPKAEEVAYMQALTYYKQSSIPQLDQSNTLSAIGMMQAFINAYPNSKYVPDAIAIIEDGRKKLEIKDYQAAQLYYDLKQYKAAGITFGNLINDYPESPKADNYMLMAIKSYYEYAKMSVPDKQQERYETVVDTYFNFIDRFPESKLLDEALQYKTNSENNIKAIQNEQHKTEANS